MKRATNFLTLALAAGLLAAGCDNGSSSSGSTTPSGGGAQQAAANTTTPPSGGFVPGAKPSGSASQNGASSAKPAAALDLTTPENAMKSYLDRLGAGDLLGAADACRPGAPGTVELRAIGTNLQTMIDNPEQRSMGEAALQLMTGELKTAESEKLSENETEAVFRVKVMNKAPDNIMVVKEGDRWFVVPPANQGMPGMVTDNASAG